MVLSLCSNIAALNAQRFAAKAQSELRSSYERLASGLRINHASDDAAGLALSKALDADSRVYTQSIRNINDGLSLLDISEGALKELEEINIRQRELATQAANGTLSLKQRRALNAEANALVDEYNRIVKTTGFNGLHVLDGSTEELRIQSGYGVSGGLTFALNEQLARAAGSGSFIEQSTYAAGTGASSAAAGDLNGDGILDLAAADTASGVVNLLTGNADGSFNSPTVLTPAAKPNCVSLADLNNDGNLDVITADYGASGEGQTASIFLGNGDGTFQARMTTQITPGTTALNISDMNGDGVPDIVAASAAAGGGTAESSTIAPPEQGHVAVTDLTFNTQVKELTNLTFTADVGINAEESSLILTSAAGHYVDPIMGNPGASEQTTIVFRDGGVYTPGVSEVTTISTCEVGGSYEQITFNFGSLTGANLDTGEGNDGRFIELPADGAFIWFNVDQHNIAPSSGLSGYEVTVNSTDGPEILAAALSSALQYLGYAEVSNSNGTLVVRYQASGGNITNPNTCGIDIPGFSCSVVDGTDFTFTPGENFTLYYPGGYSQSFYFTVDGDGWGSGTEIELSPGWSAGQVADQIAQTVNGPYWSAVSNHTSSVTITANVEGDCPNSTGWNVSQAVDGADGWWTGNYTAGSGFTLYWGGNPYENSDYWFRVDGQGAGSGTAIDISTDWSAAAIAYTVACAVSGGTFTGTYDDDSAIITRNALCECADASANSNGIVSLTVTRQGAEDEGELVPGYWQQDINGKYFTFGAPSGDFHVWYDVDGGCSSDPLGCGPGIGVALSVQDDAPTVAAKTAAALNSYASSYGCPYSASAPMYWSNELWITSTEWGNVTNAGAGSLSWAVTTSVEGSLGNWTGGEWFTLGGGRNNPYYVWYTVDGVGIDPAPSGASGVRVDLTSGMTADYIAYYTACALNSVFAASLSANTLSLASPNNGTCDMTHQSAGNISVLRTPGSEIGVSTAFCVNTPDTDYRIWFSIDSTGGDPTPWGTETPIQVNISASASNADLAAAVVAALDGQDYVSASTTTPGSLRITNDNWGSGGVADGSVGGGMSISSVDDGHARPITTGHYFLLDAPGQPYYVWYDVDGGGGDPHVTGASGIRVQISGTNDMNTVAQSTANAINAAAGSAFTASAAGGGALTVTNKQAGAVTDARNGNLDGTFSVTVNTQGSRSSARITLGAGGGTFGGLAALDLGNTPSGLIAADVNNDGALDLVFTDSSSNSLNVSLGNGDGTFGTASVYAAGSGPQSVAAADFDLDGDIDVATANSSANSVSVFMNSGNGRFLAARNFAANSSPQDITADDFNGDGLTDLFVCNSSVDAASLLLGNGDGTFQAARSTSTGDNPTVVIAADFNSDSCIDFLTLNAGGSGDSNVGVSLAEATELTTMPYLHLTSEAGAREAMDTLDQNLERIKRELGAIGASESRLETASKTVATARDNFDDAESRITDADMAAETAALTRQQILQQISFAVLAQTNQSPALALELLSPGISAAWI